MMLALASLGKYFLNLLSFISLSPIPMLEN